jgi:hypothetical protein
MDKHYQFVGGPFDGKKFLVPGPVDSNLELRVYPVEPWVPGSSYLLGQDGRFRFADGDRQARQLSAREDSLLEHHAVG